MQTENLNAMIHPDLEKHMGFIEIDDPLPKDTMVNVDSNPQTQIVPKVNTAEILAGSYEPESEEALIAYTANIHNRVQTYSISGYWEIGRSINAFYKGKYGTKELERISQATGIGRDTLAKACRFARQYSKENVETLLRGRFVLSWGQIAQNLAIAPQKVIEVYQQAPSREQFYNGIIKLKDPSETRGKSRKQSAREIMEATGPEADQSLPLTADSHRIAGGGISQELTHLIEATEAVPIDEKTAEKHIEALREENERVRKELEDTRHQLDDLKNLFHDAAKDIARKSDLIDRLRDALCQVYEMVDNGCNHEDMLAEVEWGL